MPTIQIGIGGNWLQPDASIVAAYKRAKKIWERRNWDELHKYDMIPRPEPRYFMVQANPSKHAYNAVYFNQKGNGWVQLDDKWYAIQEILDVPEPVDKVPQNIWQE